MGSTQSSTAYQMVKMNKTGSKVVLSAQKGSQVTKTTPQQGHWYFLASSQPSATVSLSPSSHRRADPGHPITPSLVSEYSRPVSPESGPSFCGASIPKGTEARSKSKVYHHPSLARKVQQTQTSASHATQMLGNVSPSRHESTQRGAESKSGCDSSNRYSLTADRKSHRLSFIDQKDNLQILQEDPPSKVQYPQGVRVPYRPMVCPKDKAVQTEPIRKSSRASLGVEMKSAAQMRSPMRPSSPKHASSHISANCQRARRRIPGQESEMGHHSSVYTEPKALRRKMNLESLRLSVLKDLDGEHQVCVRPGPECIRKPSAYTETRPSSEVLVSSEVESSMKSSIRGDSEVGRRVTISPRGQSVHRVTFRAVPERPHRSAFVMPEPIYKQPAQRASESACVSPGPTLRYPEPSQKPSLHAELELTPRPLPPRSLPKYGPDSSWWALLSLDAETCQSRPTAPDFKPKCPPARDLLSPFFETDSGPFCKDQMFQREKASPSLPPAPAPKESPNRAPLREVPQAPKHASKKPIQWFSAFILGM